MGALGVVSIHRARSLLKAYGIKRVFILGAGFSAPLGLPLTRDLLQLVYEVAEKKPWYVEEGTASAHGQGGWLLEKINWYFPLDRLDHESIKNGKIPAGFDLERFLSYVASCSAFVMKTGERWNEHGDKFVAFLKAWAAEAIARRQREALRSVPGVYGRFVESLPGSLVISFNWDTVVESLLDERRQRYAFDLHSTYDSKALSIIKLHGSIDWFSKPSDAEFKDWMVFHALTDNFETCVRAEGDLLRYYNSHLTPWIVIPSYDKISQILQLGDLWQTPWMFLQDELEVVVIGFSMRLDDFHTRAFIYPQLVHGSRSGSLSVKVVDYASDEEQQREIKTRYAGVENCKFYFEGFSENALGFIDTA